MVEKPAEYRSIILCDEQKSEENVWKTPSELYMTISTVEKLKKPRFLIREQT